MLMVLEWEFYIVVEWVYAGIQSCEMAHRKLQKLIYKKVINCN